MEVQHNKKTRSFQETKSLFADPKTSRQAWQAIGRAILMRPATRPIVDQRFDKDGNSYDTTDYLVERYSYENLAKDIKELEQDVREPTELEMIFRCQAVHARHNPASATFIRDSIGLKPVDESKVEQTVHNPYETLSDEELELLAAARAARAARTSGQPSQPLVAPHDCPATVQPSDAMYLSPSAACVLAASLAKARGTQQVQQPRPSQDMQHEEDMRHED